MNLNNYLSHKDFDLKDFNDMKDLPEFQRADLKDHLYRSWASDRTREGKVYLKGFEGVGVELRPASAAAYQDSLYAAEDCLIKPSEIWQTVSGDRYTHMYMKFYQSGALIVSVSFSHNMSHKIDSIKFIKNPDTVRKGVLYG